MQSKAGGQPHYEIAAGVECIRLIAAQEVGVLLVGGVAQLQVHPEPLVAHRQVEAATQVQQRVARRGIAAFGEELGLTRVQPSLAGVGLAADREIGISNPPSARPPAALDRSPGRVAS